MQQPEEPDERVVGVTPDVPELGVLRAEAALPESDVPVELESPPKREPFWGYTDVALVFGLLFAFSAVLLLLVGLLALRYPKLRTDPTPIAMPVQILFYVAVYFSFRVVFALRYHEPVLRSLGWRRPHINLVVVGLGGFLLAFILSALGSLLRTPKIDLPFNQFTSSPASLAAFAVVAVVLAPIFEEMFFRGFIQPPLSRSFGAVAGILLTACLFGALHGFEYQWVWQYALFITAAGVVFGWLAGANEFDYSIDDHAWLFHAVSVVALAFGKNI